MKNQETITKVSSSVVFTKWSDGERHAICSDGRVLYYNTRIGKWRDISRYVGTGTMRYEKYLKKARDQWLIV